MKDLSQFAALAVLPLGDDGGAFEVFCPKTSATLRVIASFGGGWDHVSVSLANRMPNWTEMEFIKRMFFRDHEWAMQLHAPPTDHINCHPNCLHLWRPQNERIPTPPKLFV